MPIEDSFWKKPSCKEVLPLAVGGVPWQDQRELGKGATTSAASLSDDKNAGLENTGTGLSVEEAAVCRDPHP